MIYIILGIILAAGLVFYLTSCSNHSDAKQTSLQIQDSTKEQKADPNNNPYFDLRNMALSTTYEQLAIELPKDKTKIYGVVMEWDLGEGTATLVSFSTGDASLYLSSGGGYIGSGGYESVKTAINCLITNSEKHLNKATLSETTELPEKNGLTFYFLTNIGRFKAIEKMENIENESSIYLDLFNEANKLITEIRVVSEKNSN